MNSEILSHLPKSFQMLAEFAEKKDSPAVQAGQHEHQNAEGTHGRIQPLTT